MPPVRRKLLLTASKIFHLGLMCVALFVAKLLHASGPASLVQFFSARVKVTNLLVLFAVIPIWHSLFRSFNLYESRRLTSRRSQLIDVLNAGSLGVMCSWTLCLLLRIRLMPWHVVLSFWLISTFLLVCGRLVLMFMLARTRAHGRNLREMLIIGTNRRAVEFARRIEGNPELGYRIIGFADQDWPKMHEFEQTGYRLACGLEALPGFFRNNVVDEVMVALPIRSSYQVASQIGRECEQQGIIFGVLCDFFDLRVARPRAEELEESSWTTRYTRPANGWATIGKRVLDLLLASVAIVATSPILLLAALLIKITSPGPVFFKQERVGQSKRRFIVYKLRTMIVDAEDLQSKVEHLNEVKGPVFKIKNDPRITPIGRFLRRSSIDELPQLFNVLKGEMSLVGPRPLPLRDYAGFYDDWHRRRFSVPPGITCLWQIKGRNSVPFEKWMELDMEYIDKWSLWLDLQILAKTIPVVLRGSGAA